MNIEQIIEEINNKSIVDKYIYLINLLDNLNFDNKEEMRKASIIFNDEKIKKYGEYCHKINSISDDNKISYSDFIQKEKNNFDSELNFYYLLVAHITSFNIIISAPVFYDVDNNTAINKLNKLIRKTKLKMINYAEMQTC